MPVFSTINELINTLAREKKLLTEMFKKRKSMDYKYEYALDLIEDNNKIQYLIEHSIIRQNGNTLEIDDLYLQFFEQVLGANEDINVSYINENLEKVTQNIDYYFDEPNEQRKYNYLRNVKSTLRKIGVITLRNVIDLKKNIDNTFKSEPNYKIKKAKLKNFDEKRRNIRLLIEQTISLIKEDNITFFKNATDEELRIIVINLRQQLFKCEHNLVEIEQQIIEFLNQIQKQSIILDKLKQIKYLRDQFILETKTNIKNVLETNNSLIFEPKPSYKLKISLDYLQQDEKVFESIKKIAKKAKSTKKIKLSIADKISEDYLENQVEEQIQINLEEVKNSFLAGSNNLFDFIMSYDFVTNISFGERVTIYCQMASQYEDNFEITEEIGKKEGIEFAIIYPK
ncbi:hypothetical protein Fleli_2101 [Bernardetia litoralis DSM 6794]|uniref:Uncharacterized protein n=1 Tax=Bernardetia litoralis (strain ATCC 23117 / DSM 6794 / NBRC 15988 / NCIMB 1366 / Fx l1 / Sio-4) TaxID=880071 RepID=I4AKJ9_BERLS|nr:hypothetical protein [Bernardetia litoralis]AFM04484.1 hypothetical protein Fleli_2101 [Bernardetia litoralis DSM 6794]